MAGDIWGTGSMISTFDYPSSPLYHLYFFLMNAWAQPLYGWVIAVQLLSVFLWFAGRWRLLMRALIFATTAMLFTSAHLHTTGGHTLLKLLVFYAVLIPENPRTAIAHALSNLALWACRIQLAIMYGFAAIFKLHGTYWPNGEALYYVLSIREFSHPWLQELLLERPLLLKLGTWFGLGYQLLFPVLVWFRKTKVPLLVSGVFFHLFIGFGLGLPDFGLFMVAVYSMFTTDAVAERWMNRLRIPGYASQRG